MTRYGRYILSAVLLLSLVTASRADVLILRNGDRIEGDIVEESPTEISIQCEFRGGKIRYVKKIKRAEIASIEKTDEDVIDSSESQADQAKPTASRSAGFSDEEGQELLANAIDKLKKKEYDVAGTHLTRLINNATHRQLLEWSAEIERKYRLTLADLAAETHMRAAAEKSKGRTFRLPLVTEFEKPSLIPRLIDAYKNALTEEILAESKRSDQKKKEPTNAAQPKNADRPQTTSRPTGSPTTDKAIASDKKSTSESGVGYAIAAYLDKPNTFDGDKEDAHALADQIRYAMGLLAERQRHDPKAKKDRALRTSLLEDKKKLQTLHKAVLARAKGALTPEEKEEQRAEMLRRQEEFRQRAEHQRMRHERYLQKAIEAAQELEQQGQPISPSQ